MKRINSRQKGKRGERQWRDVLREHGYQARRGQQFSGSPESPDVVCPDLPWAHFEVKCVENLSIEKAFAQARKDAAKLRVESRGVEGSESGKVPVVVHRRDLSSPLPHNSTRPDTSPRPSPQGGEGEETKAGVGRVIAGRSDASHQGGEGEESKARVPIVAHRRNHSPWLVTMEAEWLGDVADGLLAGGCFFAQHSGRRLNLRDAMESAVREAKGRAAFVVHGRKGLRLVTMQAQTFFRVLGGEIKGISNLRFPISEKGKVTAPTQRAPYRDGEFQRQQVGAGAATPYRGAATPYRGNVFQEQQVGADAARALPQEISRPDVGQ